MATAGALLPPLLTTSPRPLSSTSKLNPNPNPNPSEPERPISHRIPLLSSSASLRHRFLSLSSPPTPALRRRSAAASASASAASASAARQAPKKPKNLLKAKESIKDLPSHTPPLHPSSSPAPPELLPNQAIGLVAAAQANFMRVIVEFTYGPTGNARVGKELLCVVRAVLKKIRRRVMVGDKVLVGAIDWVDRRGMIEDVFGRRSAILDPPVANVDHLLVLFSMEQPKPEPFTLTRFLVEAESTGIPLTLVLNKVELVDEEISLAWKDRLHAWGYGPLFCSVKSKCGLAALEDILKGQTTVVVGPSGVGKSSLINSLRTSQHFSDEEEVNHLPGHIEGSKWSGEQRVGTVSERSGKGKHTTRHVSLLPLSEGGYLADTPGFNQPTLSKVAKKTLAETFPEIRQKFTASEPVKCSFNDCLHLGEPGCIVKANWERYPYYLQLLDEIKIREEIQLRMLGTKREGDVRYKVGNMGVKQPEPRLVLKKHRRVSRKQLNQSLLDDFDDTEEDNLLDTEGNR